MTLSKTVKHLTKKSGNYYFVQAFMLSTTRLSPKQSGFVRVFRVSQIAVHCARKERRETNKRVGVQGRRFEFLNEQHVLSVFCFVRQEIGTLSSGLLGSERCVRCCCQAM